MATFVLVHGGGHGGWCFQPLAAILRAEGHLVYAPSLTGLADRQHLLSAETDLDMQIEDIARLMEFEDLCEVILVGYSYGGMVITGAADRTSARTGHLVYLDAAIPLDGEALVDVSPGLKAFAANNRVIDGVELGLFPDAAASAVYGLDGSPLRD
ncbi:MULTISPECIES: alpha/beta fold hydrolase [unclassified Novosphingobium]|uniref:alpha/beta fold hydrolase n=1 Tax=unclassified Novosphingobium TaxID=2644732 RepID=UPI001F15DA4F|nr:MULTISPECIES: alpha/beta hydrolase [unclassified Novosphingobium]